MEYKRKSRRFRVEFRVSEELYLALHRESLQQDTTIAALVRGVLTNFIEQQQKG